MDIAFLGIQNTGAYISIIVALYLFNFFALINMVVVERKNPNSMFAWLLVLVFLPMLGFILYFFLGSTRKLEVLNKKYQITEIEEKQMKELSEQRKEISKTGVFSKKDKTNKYQHMIKINFENAKSYFSEDNKVELLINGQEKFPRLIEEIKKAKHSINVEYFIFKSKDNIGMELIALLAEKAAQGVEVRVLFDGMGCLKTRLKDFDPIVKNGGKVQRFLPSMIRTLAGVNYRLHRKMVIVDGYTCITGGINVGDDYLGLYPKITPWRDTSILFTGSAVDEMQELFLKDWLFCAKQNKKYKKIYDLTATYATLVNDKYFPKPKDTSDMG
ncbi:MAG: phospholipase D-like domain-containing protein, partial [Anaerovoracaceae bacterium]